MCVLFVARGPLTTDWRLLAGGKLAKGKYSLSAYPGTAARAGGAGCWRAGYAVVSDWSQSSQTKGLCEHPVPHVYLFGVREEILIIFCVSGPVFDKLDLLAQDEVGWICVVEAQRPQA